MPEEFIPPPEGEPIPAPGPSDKGAPVLPDPPDDGTEYVDPLLAQARDQGEASFRAVAATLIPPTGAQVLAYAQTFKGIAKGRKKENVNQFTEWYYGNETAASFCLIFICYVFNHFGMLKAFLGGKIAYCPDLKHRVGSKFHTAKGSIAPGDPVLYDFNNSNEPEHVGLFVKWLNDAHTEFESYDANTTGNGSDDYIGPKTRYWSDVFGYVKPGMSPDDPSTYTGTIYRYIKGKTPQSSKHIEWMQEQLNAKGAKPKLTTDGVYGKLTATEVRDFQKANHLTVDGEVGPKTWSVLAK